MNISKKSLLTFCVVNGSLISFSLINYVCIFYINDLAFFNKLWTTYCVYLSRKYLMMTYLSYVTRYKRFISPANSNSLANYQPMSHLYVLSATFVDAMTSLLLYDRFIYNERTISRSLLYFIPVSLPFEIILDFFHYWMHRIAHLNKILYIYIHKTHHRHVNPVFINAFYFSPVDSVWSLTIPMVLTVSMSPYRLSLFDYVMLSVYREYTELAGHSGKMLAPGSSFPQCIWIPRLLKIQLYAEDHNLHHKVGNCNFAKRFSLWDKLFGTYNSGVDAE